MRPAMRFLILFLIVLASSAHAQHPVEQNASLSITGIINFPAAAEKEFVFFEKQLLPANRFVVIDSVEVDANRKFTRTFSQLPPGYYRLRHTTNSRLMIIDAGSTSLRVNVDTASFATESGRVKFIKINLEGSELISRTQRYFDIGSFYYRNYISPVERQLRELASVANTNPHILDSLNSALKSARSKMIRETSRYVLDSMDVSIGIYQTMNSWDNSDLTFMNAVMEKFRSRKPDSFILPFMEARYKTLVDTRLIGRNAPAFSLPDDHEQAVDLNTYVGKKILLDFWASWCGPCIKEMKAYKEIIKKIEAKGIVVISISLDKNPEHWKKSLLANEFPWVQLIDTESKTGKAYGIQFMPTNYLIDIDGKIIAKNVTLQELISTN
jgi:peroxiredoxin